jgi:hypothetical protein
MRTLQRSIRWLAAAVFFICWLPVVSGHTAPPIKQERKVSRPKVETSAKPIQDTVKTSENLPVTQVIDKTMIPVASVSQSDYQLLLSDFVSSVGIDSSDHYCLTSTGGQATVGTGSSPNYGLSQGFWQVYEPATCCVNRVGDANGEGEYPDEVTLGDIMLLVDVKFISGNCSILACVAEADVNQDGGVNPNCDDHVTLGDIMTLVDFLFISNTPLKECL